MKRYVIRAGDIVRIINPEFFIRCGYPLSLTDGMKKIMEIPEDKRAIHEFASRFGVDSNSKDFRSLVRIAAYRYLIDNNFGGRDRKIYTRRIESAKGHTFEVFSKKMVVTGKYYPGCKSVSFEETEYDPPYLDMAQSHMILYLNDGSMDGEGYYVRSQFRLNYGIVKEWEISSNADEDIFPLAIERSNIEVVK